VQHLAEVRQALGARIAAAADGTLRVARAVDRNKDQSYVLFGLRAELLPHVLFPVGGLPKAEIRAIARDRGLPVHDKPESQEICFVPDDDYLNFVRGRRPGHDTSGPILDEQGRTLGTHDGIEGYTIGQRRGLGVAVGAPRYVVQIEPAARAVTIGPRESLDRGGLEAVRFNWQGEPPEGPRRCLAQIRARHQAVPATMERREDGRARVVFDSPQSAVTPGQVVTLYEDDLVLGGGWIERALLPEASSPAPG
jgi:tRNA-specific 2-thiouridylase